MIMAAKIIPARLVVQLFGTPNSIATRRPPSRQTRPLARIKMINRTFMEGKRRSGELACSVSSPRSHYMSLDWKCDTVPAVGVAFQRI